MSTENEPQAAPAPAPEEAKAPAQAVAVREKIPDWMNNPITLGEHGVFGGNQSFALAQRMANALAHSTLVPVEYQLVYQKGDLWYDNPNAIGNCIIALELSTRLDLSVLTIMQQVDVIHGRPSFRAQLLTGLVNKSPLFGRMRFEWKDGVPEDSDDYGCRAIVRDAETGEWLVGTWVTWKMVRAEGWDAKKGSKWKSMPGQMFMYRAATLWSRVYAPDLMLGLPTADEVEDVTDDRTALRELNQRLDRQLEPEGDAGQAPAAAPAATSDAEPPRARRRRASAPAAAPLDQAEPDAAAPVGESSGDPAVEEAPSTPAAAPAPAPAVDAGDNYDVE